MTHCFKNEKGQDNAWNNYLFELLFFFVFLALVCCNWVTFVARLALTPFFSAVHKFPRDWGQCFMMATPKSWLCCPQATLPQLWTCTLGDCPFQRSICDQAFNLPPWYMTSIYSLDFPSLWSHLFCEVHLFVLQQRCSTMRRHDSFMIVMVLFCFQASH